MDCRAAVPGFNSRSPSGERQGRIHALRDVLRFQLTLPERGATDINVMMARGTNVSTHAPRAGSDPVGVARLCHRCVSTHAPRAGSDHRRSGQHLPTHSVSTHAPRAGSDHRHPRILRLQGRFNSRSPSGERLMGVVTIRFTAKVSTHAPRAGSDTVAL